MFFMQLIFFFLIKFGFLSQEYHDNVGDLEGPEEKERAQSKIQKFISAF